MRLFVCIFSVIFLSTGMAEAGASARIYLYPRVEGKADLSIGDIATVEGAADELETLAGLTINEELFSDGYLDSREIDGILRTTGIQCVIYGNAVRVVAASGDVELQVEELPLIKRGDHVTVFASRGAIRIQVTGTALSDGMKGDDVSVRTRGRGILSGRVLDRKTVEIGL